MKSFQFIWSFLKTIRHDCYEKSMEIKKNIYMKKQWDKSNFKLLWEFLCEMQVGLGISKNNWDVNWDGIRDGQKHD